MLAGQIPTHALTRFYSAGSFWNQPIEANPNIDSTSAAMIEAAILPDAARSAFANGDDWAIALVHARAGDKIYDVACLQFYCNGPVSFRIPQGALPTTGSDHHLVVVYGDKELDMWNGTYDARKDTWSAGAGTSPSCTDGARMHLPASKQEVLWQRDFPGWAASCALRISPRGTSTMSSV
jgi:hypothetical protein